MKIYGNEKTNLQLSEKAAAMYAQCDPLTITEHDDGTYSLSGVEDRDNMTADDVNQWLEDLADDCGEEDTVVNEWGVAIKINAALELMDEDIYQDLDARLNPCSAQELFDAYCKAHEEKYGEPWELAKANPVY